MREEGVARSVLIVQQLKAFSLFVPSPPAAFVCIFVAIKPRRRAFRKPLATSENVSTGDQWIRCDNQPARSEKSFRHFRPVFIGLRMR